VIIDSAIVPVTSMKHNVIKLHLCWQMVLRIYPINGT